MLRIVRVIIATVVFALVTLLFFDFTGTMSGVAGWIPKIQFLPAVLALNLLVVAILVVLTLVCGRIYCSVICPLGIFQDVVSWLHGKFKKNRFVYKPEMKVMRYGFLVLFVGTLLLGFGSIAGIIEPYSAFGRIMSNIFQPLYILGNNALADVAEKNDSVMFYHVDLWWIKSLAVFVIAIVTFLVVSVIAWIGGRLYCNTVCPVGTVLGFLSRFAWLKPVIDADKCNKCGLCARNCKSQCINFKEHEIDYSRCVACMDCIGKCHKSAISFSHPKKSPKTERENVDTSKRAFIATAVTLASASVIESQAKKVDGGLAVVEDKVAPTRKTAITPAGSLSAKNVQQHCTACQLCITACPNGVLRPSTDIETFMQPQMSYERGYCRPECTRCADACPVGAIKPITVEEKSSTQIGHAVWIKKNCIPLTDGVECGNCARHCPSGAIMMVPSDEKDETSLKIPVIDTEVCIGCGACENLCPARPFSAIYVEGHEVHRTI